MNQNLLTIARIAFADAQIEWAKALKSFDYDAMYAAACAVCIAERDVCRLQLEEDFFLATRPWRSSTQAVAWQPAQVS
jgi:hypothetical protein